MEITGKIFNIQRFSIYDGPGARTVVFFSGCNLKCAWCHNPESVSNRQQLKFNFEQCILCGRCFELCERGAHKLKDGAHILDRSKCEACGRCAGECWAEALVPVCRGVTVPELEKSIKTDEPYFKNSGGGVTFSGGEPMLQADFLREILKVCKTSKIHTAVDTAGAVEFEAFEKIMPFCDLFLYDVKTYDANLHKKLTGVSNKLILENLKRLAAVSKVLVRVPVIAGANGNIGEMEAIAKFLKETDINRCELLPYHKFGEGKYISLGMPYENIFEEPRGVLMDEIRALFCANDINVM
ncbi:MAG: glycyl-radical enzyme activating protein [Oscillospiraceae bacterium]|nr:glycyl-radical enzyme activating protein [Oscillospiraceae bacterium]